VEDADFAAALARFAADMARRESGAEKNTDKKHNGRRGSGQAASP
jgi:hypothetical protein